MVFFQEEWNTHSKLDYYLAQIAFHVYNLRFIIGGKPDKNEADFLIKFLTDKPVELTEEELEEKARAYAAQQKLAILGSFGFGADGISKTKPLPNGKQPSSPQPKPVPKVPQRPIPQSSPQKSKPQPTTRKR